jgi:hypothetical protein
VHGRAGGRRARPEAGSQQVAIVMVAWDRVHGYAKGCEQLVSLFIGSAGGRVGKIAAEQHRMRPRRQLAHAEHCMLQAPGRAGPVLAQAQMQIAELNERGGRAVRGGVGLGCRHVRSIMPIALAMTPRSMVGAEPPL